MRIEDLLRDFSNPILQREDIKIDFPKEPMLGDRTRRFKKSWQSSCKPRAAARSLLLR